MAAKTKPESSAAAVRRLTKEMLSLEQLDRQASRRARSASSCCASRPALSDKLEALRSTRV